MGENERARAHVRKSSCQWEVGLAYLAAHGWQFGGLVRRRSSRGLRRGPAQRKPAPRTRNITRSVPSLSRRHCQCQRRPALASGPSAAFVTPQLVSYDFNAALADGINVPGAVAVACAVREQRAALCIVGDAHTARAFSLARATIFIRDYVIGGSMCRWHCARRCFAPAERRTQLRGMRWPTHSMCHLRWRIDSPILPPEGARQARQETAAYHMQPGAFRQE